MAPFLLWWVLPMVTAKINIALTGTLRETDPYLQIYLMGSDNSLISDEEKIYFNLTDDNLKTGVKNYFGKEPSEVFLKSPTPWGNLYKTLQWQPIYRNIIPEYAKILKVNSKNMTILEQTFENHGKKTVVYNVGALKTVENIVKSVWENDSLSVIDDVFYQIVIDSAGTNIAFGYTSKWGHDSEQGQLITVGTPHLEISVDPFNSIISKLQTTRVDVIFEVYYTSFLSGYLATHYPNGYQGHEFWGLDIKAVMDRGNLNNELRAKEIVEFTFYTNSRLIINDKNTGKK